MASSGNPPPYAFAQRMYRSNLRPILLICTVASAVWTFVWAIGLFKEIHTDKSESEPKLADFAIALGVLYMVTAVFQAFGAAAAALQRPQLAKIYTWLSVGSALLVVTAGLIRVIIHFMLKDELISECTTVVSDGDVDFVWGIWGMDDTSDSLNGEDPSDWCNKEWSHDSWIEIISLLVFIVFMTCLVVLSFGYYAQLSNPNLLSYPNARLPNTHNAFDPSVNPYAANAPYNSGGYYGYNSSSNNANYSSANLYNPAAGSMPHLGYDQAGPGHQFSRPPSGPPPGWSDRDLSMGGDGDKAPAYEPGGYGIGDGERDAKVFDSDRESVRKDRNGDREDWEGGRDPFSDFDSERQEERLREHSTGGTTGLR